MSDQTMLYAEDPKAFLLQQRKVSDLIEARLKKLAYKYEVPVSSDNHNHHAINMYIAETKGMEQVDKLKWLSFQIGDNHMNFMVEWSKVNDMKQNWKNRIAA